MKTLIGCEYDERLGDVNQPTLRLTVRKGKACSGEEQVIVLAFDRDSLRQVRDSISDYLDHCLRDLEKLK